MRPTPAALACLALLALSAARAQTPAAVATPAPIDPNLRPVQVIEVQPLRDGEATEATPTTVNHCARPYTVARRRSPGFRWCASAKASLTTTSSWAKGAGRRPARRYSRFCRGWT